MFARRGAAQTRLSALMLVLLVLGTACGGSAQRAQMGQLFDRLAVARTQLGEQPPRMDGCEVVGDVQSRLGGEPGLVDVRPAWPALRDAADALTAVCGQAVLLGEPFLNTPATTAGRQRWQQGIQRELGIACDRLNAAAGALGRAAPC